MSFEEVIAGAGEKLGVGLEVVDRATNLMLDDMEIAILELPELESVVFSGKIAEPPPQGLLRLYEAMLDANFNFAGTGGASLARNPETGVLTLTRCVPLREMDVDAFLSVLERFANVLETWSKIIRDYRPDETDAGKPTPPEMPAFGGGFMQV